MSNYFGMVRCIDDNVGKILTFLKENNLDNNIIEELLTGLVSQTLLDLEIKDFDIQLSKNSLSQKIKLNKNFVNENGIFERMKY
mgnify:CR=1 FL=1